MTILIAEDEHDNYLYLEILLENKVKRTDHAINGKIALELAASHLYDLILLDLKMPVMNGFETIHQLKALYPSIPVIAQTAYAQPEEKAKALSSGFDDYLTKPIIKAELLALLKKYSKDYS